MLLPRHPGQRGTTPQGMCGLLLVSGENATTFAQAIETWATPAGAGNLPQGGFRASALPLRTFSDRHVIHSICRGYPPKRVLTGRPYLFRFAPRTTFRPSAPRTRAFTLSTIRVPPYRQLSRQAWLPRCRWDELYAPGAALSIPLRAHAGDPVTGGHVTRAHARQPQGSHMARRRLAAAIRDSLRTASHSHLTVFDNALYRETI